MTDVTISPLRDLREVTEEPAPPAQPDRAAQAEARLADALALIAKLDAKGI